MRKDKPLESNLMVFVLEKIERIRYKDFRLTDNTTGRNIKINAPDLNEAKKESENFLKDYWNSVYKDLGKIIGVMN